MELKNLVERDVRTDIDKLIKKYKIPAVSISIIQNFRIQNLFSLGKNINEKTLFQAASISKFLTALITMKLIELRKLELRDDANKYLTGFKIRNKQGLIKKVTIKQLLSHTGGISCSGFRGYSHKEKIPNINEILNSKPPSNNEKIFVKYKPNVYHYSGGGYVILQKVIESVTGDKFEIVAKKLIFNQLKMNRSSFKQFDRKSLRNFASGYEGRNKIVNDFFIYPEKAAAGLWTTAEDLSKLLIEVQLSYKGVSKNILSKRLIKMMLKPVKLAERNFIGLGIFISKDKDTFYHAGSNVGYRSKFMADFKGNGVIILTNSSKGYDFINKLVKRAPLK